MDPIMREAARLQDSIRGHRRYLHGHAELGMDLPVTKAYVVDQLTKMGYEPVEICPSGIVALAGKREGRTFLLRADMDALPIKEEGELDFKSETGNMHACGHDTHASMLLGAARLLKDHEAELPGRVKLMFQPGEETLSGAKAMVDAGVLENPKVDAAMMIHSASGFPIPAGSVIVSGDSVASSSGDAFRFEVTGKGSHGAMPNLGVDPLNVLAHIHLSLQEILAREVQPGEMVVVTVGQMHGGTAANVLPETGFLEGTIRTRNEATRAFAKNRVKEIAESVAATFRAQVKVSYPMGVPSVRLDPELSRTTAAWAAELLEGVSKTYDGSALPGPKFNSGSEDFAHLSQRVPSVIFVLGLGSPEEGHPYPMHHPKVSFDDSKLYVGAGLYAGMAMRWLAAKA